jgi:hypothetical protein
VLLVLVGFLGLSVLAVGIASLALQSSGISPM